MAFGIDIYRYQTVNDWSAVKRAGVTFVYVKGTDGGGQAPVHADVQVGGAHAAGIPVGLYHFAQKYPSPENQADVLTNEVRRLHADGLPPALDLEDNPPAGLYWSATEARQFAMRFLARLRNNGFARVCLYSNTSTLSAIGADTLGISGTEIWAANYGANDGRQHAYTYSGHVDVHQYTSVGGVPGIVGNVDLNQSLTDFSGPVVPDPKPTPKDDDTMIVASPHAQILLSGGVVIGLGPDSAGPVNDGTVFPRLHVTDDELSQIVANSASLLSVPAKLDALTAKLSQLSTGSVDAAALASAVADHIGDGSLTIRKL